MSLTPDLVALVHREIPDAGPVPGAAPMTDADYAEFLAQALAPVPPGSDIWIFACGSLIWKPEFPIEEQRPALLRGWHRSFCIRLVRYRGTEDCPGLMMALDRGGACQGVVQRVAGKHAQERLDRLLRREMSVKPSTNRPRWVTAECGGVRVPAIAIAAHRDGFAYAGRHSLEETAAILARACGHWGSCAEYLMNTVAHLEALGIHDRYLWQLQERVAEEIRAARERPFAPATAPARRLG
jgi:cation transport protein ChaC